MLSIVPTTAPAPILYPRDRCKELRARCMMQARKHREQGNKSDAATWARYALYWSTRVRTGCVPKDADVIVARRSANRPTSTSATMVSP